MKAQSALLVLAALLSVALVSSGCTVVNDDPDVAVAPRTSSAPTVVRGQPDVNIEVKNPDIEIKQDPPPPTKATTGF
jgi:hypothetical protein